MWQSNFRSLHIDFLAILQSKVINLFINIFRISFLGEFLRLKSSLDKLSDRACKRGARANIVKIIMRSYILDVDISFQQTSLQGQLGLGNSWCPNSCGKQGSKNRGNFVKKVTLLLWRRHKGPTLSHWPGTLKCQPVSLYTSSSFYAQLSQQDLVFLRWTKPTATSIFLQKTIKATFSE